MPLRRFFSRPDPQKKELLQILTLAMDMRATFHLDLSLNKQPPLQLQGVCTKVGPDFLCVELRNAESSVAMVGAETHVYFNLRKNRVNVPYDFSCEVLRAERRQGNSLLFLSLPEQLGNNQRRYNVRIAASSDDIRHFHIWIGLKASADPAVAKRHGQLRWKTFANEDAQLIDISAGGLQFGVRIGSPYHAFLALGEKLLVSGVLELKNKAPQRLLLAGTVSRLVPDESGQLTRVGVRFHRWASIEGKQHQWLPIRDTEGVPPLAAWVLQTILIRHRSDRLSAED